MNISKARQRAREVGAWLAFFGFGAIMIWAVYDQQALWFAVWFLWIRSEFSRYEVR